MIDIAGFLSLRQPLADTSLIRGRLLRATGEAGSWRLAAKLEFDGRFTKR